MANISSYLNNIRLAIFGKDIRSSIASGIEAINIESEQTKASQVQLNETFKGLIINAGNSNAEIVMGRVDSQGNNFDTIGDRISNIEEGNVFINVKNFGAKGDGVNDTVAIKKAFEFAKNNGSVNLYFPKGTYVLSDYITIYSNTHVKMDNEAIIKKAPNSANIYKLFVNGVIGSNLAEGYNGNSNITFENGIIDLNYPNTALPSGGLSAFDLGHGNNITFKNLTVKNGQDGHYFQVAGCSNVVFDSCKFKNQNHVDTASNNFEVIQIEPITETSFPSFGKYDNAISKSITIKNCEFEGVIRGIGNHSFVADVNGVPTIYCNDINIVDNFFAYVDDECLSLRAYTNVNARNNKFATVGGFATRLDYCLSCIIDSNRTYNVNKSGLYITNSNSIRTSKNNWIDTCKTVSAYSIIRIDKSSKININNETCKNATVTQAHPLFQTECTDIFIDNCELQAGLSDTNALNLGDASSITNANNGLRQKILFDGFIDKNTTTATLTDDIRNYAMLVIAGNDNSSETASITSMTIPKCILTIGSTTSRFRLVPDSGVTSGETIDDRIDFSFPSATSIKVDTQYGTGGIRKVIGIY